MPHQLLCSKNIYFQTSQPNSTPPAKLYTRLCFVYCFYYYHFCVFLQKPQVIGVRKEMKIGDLIQQNTTLKKFGIFMEVPTARVKVVGAIERNNDDGSYSSIVIS